MMKRTYMLTACVLLFAAACSNNEDNNNESSAEETGAAGNADAAEENSSETNEAEEDTENEEGNRADAPDDENGQNEQHEDNNGANEENAVEEEEEPGYYSIQGDSSLAPVDDEAEEQAVLITIDDAPDQYGVAMAEKLDELDVPAIFFVNGHFINDEEGARQLEEIHELGFEIGNHTMTHPNLSDIPQGDVESEIIELSDMIEEITGDRPRFFRAPFGVNTDFSDEVIESEGMQRMNWTYGYDFDADYMEKEALEEIMVETELLRPGANLLMHDRDFTYEALDVMIEGLEDKGYEFIDPDHIE
ncbi:polysaccharide deacetylase family protein [Alkalicoccus chagannorensis]|uniref:polysaccharide deacetylase family protein n=1 Tax=Alkalicoccus chagannorensis TaxID=427072 RepID=UPI00040A2CF2|nr:polysaccharide deacetylase family protein [Alkalicoccus chagannorensis]